MGSGPSQSRLAPPPRPELREPCERAQPEPERREEDVEDEQREGEREHPQNPAPDGNRRLRLQRFFLCSTWRMIRRAISSIESSETSITGQRRRRWIAAANSRS